MTCRLLVVDDEPTTLMAYRKLFRSSSVAIDTAESAVDAVGLLERNTYRAIIVDLRLTGTTGTEGFDIIRHVKATSPDTGVILVTAYGSPPVQERARDLGAAFYFEKPVPIRELRKVLESLGVRNSGEKGA
jgi:DNA-binding response OmpR family regulator